MGTKIHNRTSLGLYPGASCYKTTLITSPKTLKVNDLVADRVKCISIQPFLWISVSCKTKQALRWDAYLRGGCCCRSFRLPSLKLTGFPGSLGGRGLTAPPAPAPPAPPAPPASRGLVGGLPPSGKGLDGLDCSPEGVEGLEAFFMGGLSLRGGGMASCFSGMLEKEKTSLKYTDSNGRHVIVASMPPSNPIQLFL